MTGAFPLPPRWTDLQRLRRKTGRTSAMFLDPRGPILHNLHVGAGRLPGPSPSLAPREARAAVVTLILHYWWRNPVEIVAATNRPASPRRARFSAGRG